MTDAEHRLWSHLRRGVLGHHFRRQHPVGPYTADFICLSARLVIEADGGQHLGATSDRKRDVHLQSIGYRTLRFWNHEVLTQTDAVLERIIRALEEPSAGSSRGAPPG